MVALQYRAPQGLDNFQFNQQEWRGGGCLCSLCTLMGALKKHNFQDEGLLQTFSLISHPELYPALMFGWPQTFGPMFLFGRPGNVFSTDNDLGMVEVRFEHWTVNY